MRLTKRILCTAVILLNVAAFIGCGGTKTVEGREKETAAPESTAAQDDVHFMMSAYGLSREELQGIDIEQLISDYELREREYTPEEIRMILADQGDMYAEDETTVLFRILSKEGGPLKEGRRISCASASMKTPERWWRGASLTLRTGSFMWTGRSRIQCPKPRPKNLSSSLADGASLHGTSIRREKRLPTRATTAGNLSLSSRTGSTLSMTVLPAI